jgi:hypothetical protein
MAHLWIETHPGDWAVVPLEHPRVQLADVLALCGAAAHRETEPDGVLVQDATIDRSPWHLLAPYGASLWVNGLPLLAGIHVMGDRDQISAADGTAMFFSTEALARVAPMPATERPMMCPRCRQRIATGDAAVRCPQCALWHHESEQYPCWTYAATCALCPQPTALDAGYQWTPMEL